MPPYINLDDLVDGCGSSDDEIVPNGCHGISAIETVATPLTKIHHRKRPVTVRTKHTYISIEGFGTANAKYRFKAEKGVKTDRRFPTLTDALVAKFCYMLKVKVLQGKHKPKPRKADDTRGELREMRKDMDALKAQNEELLKIVKHIRYILEE